MLTIKIDKDEPTREDIALYLEYLADQVRKDFYVGEGWDLSGSDESDEDEEEVEKTV